MLTHARKYCVLTVWFCFDLKWLTQRCMFSPDCELGTVSHIANLLLPLCNMRAHPDPAPAVEMFMIRMFFFPKKAPLRPFFVKQAISQNWPTSNRVSYYQDGLR